MADTQQDWVLQLCHGYDGPFLDCARQYAALFKGTPYKVCTVYLTGEENEEVRIGSESDKVIFLNYRSRQLRGLKINPIRAIRRLHKSLSFKFCLAHRYKPTYVALMATEVPVCGINHAFGVYDKLSRQLFARAFRKRLNLICVSDAVRGNIRNKLNWSHTKIETLYNRININAVQDQQLSRSDSRTFLGLPNDAWIIGNVGRLHPDKDQQTLIKGFASAVPRLPDHSLLVLIGTGRLEEDLRGLARKLNVESKVMFLGQVPNAKYYFKAFDVFVLTSDHEPFGMVLLEAMAAGLPIIASNCGGAKEIVSGYGEPFPLGDHNKLAEKLVTTKAADTNFAAKSFICLKESFSDESARNTFWSLAMIAPFRQEEVI
ncbi:MAG: glycosyltransferase [Desulfuromonadaceae bacterium]